MRMIINRAEKTFKNLWRVKNKITKEIAVWIAGGFPEGFARELFEAISRTIFEEIPAGIFEGILETFKKSNFPKEILHKSLKEL